MNSETNKQAGREQTGKQRQAGRKRQTEQTEQAGWQAGKQTDRAGRQRQTGKQRQAGRQAGRDRLTEREKEQTGRPADRPTERQSAGQTVTDVSHAGRHVRRQGGSETWRQAGQPQRRV